MAQEHSQPDPGVILDLLEAFRRSKTMFAAVSLGVFDALESGPRSAVALAQTLRLDADALERLLDGCVCLQILKKEGLALRQHADRLSVSLQAKPGTHDRLSQLLE